MNSDTSQHNHKKSSSGLTRKHQQHHRHHQADDSHASAATNTTTSSAMARSAEHHHQRQQQHQHQSHGGPDGTGDAVAAGGAEKVAAHPAHSNPNDLQHLKAELDREKQHRHQAQCDYADLKRRLDECSASFASARQHPVSKYDQQIAKQSYFNETLAQQIAESKEKLKEMSHSLKHIQACGKECDIHTRDLVIDYHCISKDQRPDHHHHHHHHMHHPPAHPHHHQHRRRRRSLDSLCDRSKHLPPFERDQRQKAKDDDADGDAANNCLVLSRGGPDEPSGTVDENAGELSKEIRRFQRMQIDLKSNLDRLQWRLDCESKIYHSVNDQYQKLQMDLYYLKNLNEKGAGNRELWMG